MVYEKCIIQPEKDIIMKQTALYGKEDRDCTACLKNSVNFLVALMHKINFQGSFLMCSHTQT